MNIFAKYEPTSKNTPLKEVEFRSADLGDAKEIAQITFDREEGELHDSGY